jgi:hypothetical protein
MCHVNRGPHLRTLNPGFNPGFIPLLLLNKGGGEPGLNPGFGVLRFGLGKHGTFGINSVPASGLPTQTEKIP